MAVTHGWSGVAPPCTVQAAHAALQQQSCAVLVLRTHDAAVCCHAGTPWVALDDLPWVTPDNTDWGEPI
jgi:hypothetical protein